MILGGIKVAFTTENRKVSDIFQRSAIYRVPRYQRDYVWKEVNWKELWIDLQFTLENENEIQWSHFLGTIVLNKSNNSESGLEVYEIIDGQQRLLTLYILMIVIYKSFKNQSTNEEANINNYIYYTFLTSLTKESEKKVMIDNELYNTDIQELIDAATNNKLVSRENKLYNVFMYFDSYLKGKNYSYLDKFLNKLLSVNIVEITSDEDEEIYNIFEVLNARGQKLKQIELLKNHIMKYVQPRNIEFIDRAKVKWMNIQNNIEHLSDPDVIIQHFAKCYIEKNAENRNSIYRLIKEEIKIEDLSEFLDALESFSVVYKEISSNDSKDSVIRYFDIKRNQQIRSLLCAIYVLNSEEIINDFVKEKALLQLRNFFFIFNTTQQTSNRTDKIISSISFKIYNCKYENEFKILFSEFMYELETYILNKDYKVMFETNQSFKYSNKDKTLKRNSRLVKYILELICDMDQKDTKLDYNALTIEHLISDNGSISNASIWNLTLTSEDINSEKLKNKAVNEKVKILKENSSIRLNLALDKYIENEEFNFDKRKVDIINAIFDDIFTFDKTIFEINNNDIIKYRDQYDFLKNKTKDFELLEILKKYGINFEIKINKDPKLAIYKERWNSYISGNY